MKMMSKIMLILGIVIGVLITIVYIAGLIDEEMFTTIAIRGGMVWGLLFVASLVINLIAKPETHDQVQDPSEARKEQE